MSVLTCSQLLVAARRARENHPSDPGVGVLFQIGDCQLVIEGCTRRSQDVIIWKMDMKLI